MIAEPQHGFTTIEGIAALLSAVAWPVLAASLVFCYRNTLSAIFPILIDKLRTADSIEVPGFKMAQAKLAIRDAVQQVPAEPPSDRVPESQVKGARSLEEKLTSAGISSSETASLVEAQVVILAKEYETVRSIMEAGAERTLKMNQVMAKMRTLGIRMFPLIDCMALSVVAGERLAVIAALQVQPKAKYLRWLTERLYVEVPFLFFHASLAINEIKQEFGLTATAHEEIQAALRHICSHLAPDQNTVRILEQVLLP